MNTTSNKTITKIKGYAEKIKNEIFLIYLFPLIPTLMFYIYLLININTKNSTFNFEITSIRFISFISTILGIYGFTCFQCKPFFTKVSTTFCSIIWWFLNFPITKNYINSMDQQNPNWNLLIFLQILYILLIIGLFFLLRLISKNQFSNRFIDVINQTSLKQKKLLSLLSIVIIIVLFIISNNSSMFQILLIFLELIIGAGFTYINKNLFSPKIVDFTELILETKVVDNANYKVFFYFVNNNIDINDCYKILITDIKIGFAAIDKTKDFSIEQRNIIKNKINNNRLVFEVYENFKEQDYDKFMNKSYYPNNCPKLKLSFNYKVVHEKSDKNIFYKLNNNNIRTQECEFEYRETSDKYIKLQ